MPLIILATQTADLNSLRHLKTWQTLQQSDQLKVEKLKLKRL